MTNNDEKAIRAIVGACIESYASGFLGSDIQYCSTLACKFNNGFGKIFEIIATKIASLFNEGWQPPESNLSYEYSSCLYVKEEIPLSHDFWNMVCKSDKGYDIVNDEYKKSIPFLLNVLI